MSVLDNIPAAEQVRDETQAGANTAARVGGLLVNMINDTAQDINQVAAEVAALPQQPFDDVEFYSTDNTGQDQWTNDQRLDFKSGGVAVKSLPVKVATEGRSGLMSAADKTKLNRLPASVVSGEDAVGNLSIAASATQVGVTMFDANGNEIRTEQIPVVQRAQNGAVSAGVVTAALQNAVDAYGQGLKIDIASRATAVVYLAGCRLYKGGKLILTTTDDGECSGTINIGVSESVSPWLNSERFAFTPGSPSAVFDVAQGLTNLQIAGNTMTINSLSITADAGHDAHLRLQVVEDAASQGVTTLAVAYPSAERIQIMGKDSGGNTITIAEIGVPTATKAGVMTYNDKLLIASIADKIDTEVVKSLSVSRYAARIEVKGGAGSGQDIATVEIGAATQTVAGVMSAADKTKLDRLPTSDELNTAIEAKCSADDAVGSIANGQSAAAQGVRVEYGRASGGYMGNFVLPLATTAANGVMSAADKTKLEGIESGAEKNTINEVQVDGTALQPTPSGAVNVQVKPLLGGAFPNTTPPSGQDGLLSPVDNSNYYLGQVNSLGFSWYMAAMAAGTTIAFEATANFNIVVPYDDGVNTPTTAGMCAQQAILSCENGRQYCLSIIAINAADGAKVNVFNLVEIITPV